MKILIACEFSGIVREAFRAKGHDAWSSDLLPTEIPSEYHLQGDVLQYLDQGWDMLIAHPPCTRLSNSGVRWLQERNLWQEMEEAAVFFNKFLTAPINKIMVENPIQHKYARALIPKYNQVVQPNWFGDPYRKATCLWLKNLPELIPTNMIPKEQCKQEVHLASPGPDRWKFRSRTYQGFANAMADQWGK